MKRENDLESGLISKSRVNKEEHNKKQDENNENKECITCSCLIVTAFTTVLCTCLLWLIIQYK